jgi:hypothetical protein
MNVCFDQFFCTLSFVYISNQKHTKYTRLEHERWFYQLHYIQLIVAEVN